jgi:hypothetical protein
MTPFLLGLALVWCALSIATALIVGAAMAQCKRGRR